MFAAFRLVSFVFATSLTIARLHALDLTPEPGFRELEGVKIPVVIFNDGKRRFQWQPPSTWKMSGGETSLLLSVPGEASTGMELRIIPRKLAEAPDGKTNPQAATEWIKPFLPALAQKQTFIQEIPSPFLIEGVGTRELTYTYTYLARDFTTSVALVNLDSEYSLAVIIYAPSKEFDRIHEEGTKSMFRWTLLKASTQRNPTEVGETGRSSSAQK
jgi:hypothetical protein